MQVIKVMSWGKGQGDHVLINAEDFNPDVHEPYVEGWAEAKAAEDAMTASLVAAAEAKAAEDAMTASLVAAAEVLDAKPAPTANRKRA